VNDRALDMVFLTGCLVLVGGGLLARRIPMAAAARMALAWAGIFAAAFLVFAFKDDLMAKLFPEAGVTQGSTLRIPMGPDGHFWVRAQVNGREVRFLIDSGASTTALSASAAQAAGIADEGGFGAAIDTANGVVIARRVHIGRLAVGPIVRRDVAAVTAPEFGETNVLGMDFLSSLGGWGVEGKSLVLRGS
jgi:aspartyl protease family protein